MEIKVIIFDVGKGDNIIVEFPENIFGLIDFNKKTSQGEPPSLTYLRLKYDELKAKGSNLRICFINITHQDKDHRHGAVDFFAWIEEKKIDIEIWYPKSINIPNIISHLRKNNDLENTFNYIYQFHKKKRTRALEGISEVKTIKNFKIYALSPLPDAIEEDINDRIVNPRNWNPNNTSTALHFRSNNLQLTFGADLPWLEWEKVIERLDISSLKDIYSDFVKASHHGAENASHTTLWEKLLKDLSHIIFTADARYPKKITLDHLSQINKEKLHKYSTFVQNQIFICKNAENVTNKKNIQWIISNNLTGSQNISSQTIRSIPRKKDPELESDFKFIGWEFMFLESNKVEVFQLYPQLQ
ncbi:hypothetical protein QNI16_27240 [Cytophagaceae bacterium YF14B1]|uniref:Uncharacterized protein n=1 Tax=Xanthocytophaga flava TaxID=3048013 RepID=A0AAE3QWT3_9BACT|nr:hypothetical protein [Xanthocytophaga flavus]MDJ1484224.1 hypothetical protein [Xanthocytophaga flavus]